MEIGASLIAGAEPFELVQPGKGALNYPAHLAQSRAVGDAVELGDEPAALGSRPHTGRAGGAATGRRPGRSPDRRGPVSPSCIWGNRASSWIGTRASRQRAGQLRAPRPPFWAGFGVFGLTVGLVVAPGFTVWGGDEFAYVRRFGVVSGTEHRSVPPPVRSWRCWLNSPGSSGRRIGGRPGNGESAWPLPRLPRLAAVAVTSYSGGGLNGWLDGCGR